MKSSTLHSRLTIQRWIVQRGGNRVAPPITAKSHIARFHFVGVAEVESLFDADKEASSSSRRRVMSSTRRGQQWFLHGSGHMMIWSPTAQMKHTFSKDLLGDIVKLALELIEELVDCCGELTLGVGALARSARRFKMKPRGQRTGCKRRDSSAGVFSDADFSAMIESKIDDVDLLPMRRLPSISPDHRYLPHPTIR